MAVYRQVHTSFWQDAFVLDLTPEEKYFYLYLLTNSKTSQCGIYELPKRIIEIETGYNRETVEKLLQRFIDYGKIVFSPDTNEIAIVNWLKYNSTKSPKVQAFIQKELEQVKNKDLIPYLYSIDTISIPYRQKEKEKEKEKEEEKEEENNTSASLPSLSEQSKQIFDHYVNTFNGFFPRGIKLTNDRKKKIEARLKEGYTVEQINLAISNIRTSEFHCGKNDRNTFYADLSFICRNGSTLEKWMNHKGGNGHDPTPTDDNWRALEEAGL